MKQRSVWLFAGSLIGFVLALLMAPVFSGGAQGFAAPAAPSASEQPAQQSEYVPLEAASNTRRSEVASDPCLELQQELSALAGQIKELTDRASDVQCELRYSEWQHNELRREANELFIRIAEKQFALAPAYAVVELTPGEDMKRRQSYIVQVAAGHLLRWSNQPGICSLRVLEVQDTRAISCLVILDDLRSGCGLPTRAIVDEFALPEWEEVSAELEEFVAPYENEY